MIDKVQAAINAIRAIEQIYPEDVASILAALSCKINIDPNRHLKLHQVAIDSIDDLSNYITDMAEA